MGSIVLIDYVDADINCSHVQYLAVNLNLGIVTNPGVRSA